PSPLVLNHNPDPDCTRLHGLFSDYVPDRAYHHDQFDGHKSWRDNGKSACPKVDYSVGDTPHPVQNIVHTDIHQHPVRSNACLVTAYSGLRLEHSEYVPVLQY